MKILQVNKFHYDRDGGTRCYFNTAKILVENGHDIAFFAMQHPKNVSSRWSKYFVENIDYNQSLNFLQKLKAIINILYNFSANKKIEKLILKFKPDIAHLHVIYHQISPSIIDVLKKHNIPVVMTLHDYKLVSPNYSLFHKGKIWEKNKQHKYYKCVTDKCVKDSYLKSFVCAVEAYFHRIIKIYEKIDTFISPSNFLINKFREFGFKGKMIKIDNPVMMKSYDKIYKNNNKKYILFFGRISQEKGVDFLIEAFKRIDNNINLIIAGEGPEKKSLEKNIKNLKLDNIKFVGYQKGRGLQALIINSEFVAVPSRWYENAPYAIVESLYLNKKVVAPDLGGMKELISSEGKGYLYKSEDLNSLVNILNKTLKNKEENNNKVKYTNKDSYYQELISVYEKAINKK